MHVPPAVRAIVATAIVLSCCAACSDAHILDVGEGQEYSSVNAAIHAAGSGDTIDVHPGVYPELLEPSVSLLIRGVEGAEVTFLDGEESHRILEFAGVALTFEDITFRNGYADNLGGGAAFYHAGSLTLEDCVIRDNRARGGHGHLRSRGGAIYLYGGNATLVCHRCLFVDNEVFPRYCGMGGAIGFTIWFPSAGNAKSGDPRGVVDQLSMSSIEILDSSFIGNVAHWSPGIYTSAEVAVEVRRSVFFDIRHSNSSVFIGSAGDPLIRECNLYWADPSPPEFDETKRGASDHVVADPRACPDLPEAIHESSPAVYLGWCGPIGNLPIGCWDPMILYAGPRSLRPVPDQMLRVYGYGLFEPMTVALVGPNAERVPAEIQAVEDTWTTLRFDLTGVAHGSWTLSMQPYGEEEALFEGITVSPVQALGLLDGWVSTPAYYDGVMFGHGFQEGIELDLLHRGSGTSIPMEIEGAIQQDTLRVSADLSQASLGIYDLQISTAWSDVVEIPGMLFLGTPEILRVPDEYTTIRDALAAAPECAEIIVASGTYAESLVIERPVRLRSAEGLSNTVLRPGAAGQRVLHILPEAGALTEVIGFTIENGHPASGPGGGIYCEAPSLIRNNFIRNNDADGPQGRGGGVFCSDGCRIINNTIYGNGADGTGDWQNPWSMESDLNGTGGGIFCSSCLVEGNTINGNYAWIGGGFVVDGSFRNNTVDHNGSSWIADAGAIRGEVLTNYFDNSCGAGEIYLLVEGPSKVGWNRFNDLTWDMCGINATICLRGSIDFYQNTLAEVLLRACLATQTNQSSPGRFRMWNNIFHCPVDLSTDMDGWYCDFFGGLEPLVPIPDDSLSFSCNLRTHTPVQLRGGPCSGCAFEGDPSFCETPRYVGGWPYGWEGWYDLRLRPDSDALPQNSPASCVDTLGALGLGCEPTPVQILSYGIKTVDGAVHLSWRMPLDLTAHGFHIDREVDGLKERITDEPVASCKDCLFIDWSPPVAGRIVYYLVILAPGDAEEFMLGEVHRGSLVPADLMLRSPMPHPVRDRALINIGLPHPGGDVRLELYDAGGRRVATLCDESMPSGWHKIEWTGRDLPSGLYIIRLATERATATGKLVLMK